MMMRKLRGFTLLELMAVVAIIAILVAIAMVQYSSYLTKSRRQDGRSKILEVAQREERYFSENATYTVTSTAMGYTSSTITSDEGFYTVTIASMSGSDVSGNAYSIADSYIITAAPTGVQASDTYCASLTYTSTSVRNSTGTGGAACW